MEATSNAYAAGFLDGEGCIGMFKRGINGQAVVRVTLANTDYNSLDRLRTIYGGNLYQGPAAKVGWKRPCRLTFVGKDAYEFLLAVSPYVVIKRPQLELAMEWYDFLKDHSRLISKKRLFGGCRVRSKDTLEKEQEFKARFHVLNKKGA